MAPSSLDIEGLYPWSVELGLTDRLADFVLDGAADERIVATIRSSEEYRRMFPGMTGPGGQRRFSSEREYLQQVQSYRTVLTQAGMYDDTTESPLDYVGFMENNIAPDELRERVSLYTQIQSGSQELKDQFFIYAGMELTDDDLFQAVVSPEFGQALQDEFDSTVASNPFDYETYISRATERGLANVSTLLSEMQAEGLVSAEAIQRIRGIDPDFAREVMGALANQGDSTLGYDALSYAFQYALLGSAATEQGLTAPSADMVERLRAAGVDRSKAMSAYGSYANTKNMLEGMVQRHTGQGFDQEQFEEASMLGTGDSLDLLSRAQGLEQAHAKRSGGFQMTQQGTRFAQQGRVR